jgi:hypothetical protein
MFWVMTVIGVKLFLREDEVTTWSQCDELMTHRNQIADMKVEDFIDDLTVDNGNGRIESLAVRIHGKTERMMAAPQAKLALWADHAHSMFCPVRHLLLYLKLSGIRTGYLFPPYSVMKDKMTTKASETVLDTSDHICYTTFLRRFKDLCKSAAPKRVQEGAKFGTHTIRKTAYLLAIWGKGDISDIMQSARHRTLRNALKYKRDSSYLLSVADANESVLLAMVPRFRTAYIADVQLGGAVVRSGEGRGSRPSTSLVTAADAFTKHQVSSDLHENIAMVCESFATPYNQRNDGQTGSLSESYTKLLSYLNEHLPSEKASHASKLLQNATQAASRAARVQCQNRAEERTNRAEESSTMLPPKRRRTDSRGGDNDLPGRDVVRKQPNTAAKLEVMKELLRRTPEEMNELTEGARNFVLRVLKPIMTCLRDHCGDNVGRFVARWGENMSHSTFAKHCCSLAQPCPSRSLT